jgi:hypothetical protein
MASVPAVSFKAPGSQAEVFTITNLHFSMKDRSDEQAYRIYRRRPAAHRQQLCRQHVRRRQQDRRPCGHGPGLPPLLPRQKSARSRRSKWRSEAHPGTVTKAYEDTKKGKKTWEVKINGNDGKKWEVHYEIKSGALVSEEGK